MRFKLSVPSLMRDVGRHCAVLASMPRPSLSHLVVWTAIALTVVACQKTSTQNDHGADASIAFEEFDLRFANSDGLKRFRLDGVVDDWDVHVRKIVQEFGLPASKVPESPLKRGQTLSWTDTNGVTWVISFVIAEADERITRANLAHEKYHALCVISPASVDVLHAAIEARGFHVEWSLYNEELRALIIEAVSLNAQGVPIASMSGNEATTNALSILRASYRESE